MSTRTEIFKCLADESRLSIVAGLCREPMYVELIAERLALSASTVSFHLKKLEAAGLVNAKKDQYYTMYTLNSALLDKKLIDLVAPHAAEATKEQLEQARREQVYRDKVLSSFFVYGKLTQIPAQRKKRLIILEEIARHFAPNRDYPEKEVNLIIAEMHDDFCTLRREMICEGLMTRDHGIYRLAPVSEQQEK